MTTETPEPVPLYERFTVAYSASGTVIPIVLRRRCHSPRGAGELPHGDRCGGADPNDQAELREPSIKAGLRFWWRTIKWPQIRLRFTNDDQAIGELRKQEAALFGSADGGQSRVLLHIKRPVESSPVKKGTVYTGIAIDPANRRIGTDRPGARYLGYGVMEAFRRKNKATGEVVANAGELVRSCIDSGAGLALEVRSRDSINKEVIGALKLLGLVGGLGSKARKGYGSLTLTTLAGNGVNEWNAPASAGAYIDEVRTLLSPTCTLTDEPPFSAFSRRSRVCLLLERKDPLSVLDDYGKQMQRYRSWGKNREVNRKPSEENFKADHDWGKKISRPTGFHPQRVVFGLPHNYGKYGDVQVTADNYERRASPLWFHVHDYGHGENRYAGLATVLRAQFLPGGERINAGGEPVTANPDYSVIDRFLAGAGRPAGSKDPPSRYFPEAKPVFP